MEQSEEWLSGRRYLETSDLVIGVGEEQSRGLRRGRRTRGVVAVVALAWYHRGVARFFPCSPIPRTPK